jgi:hypothetical protein
LKALKEKIQAVQMAKEHLAQMNIMEDCEEDDSPVLHPQLSSHSSTMSHKRCHLEVETDSDECFDLREVVHGSDTDSSSESDKAAKTKAKGKKRVKGAARQELVTMTEELRGAEQQKLKHDIGR